MSNGVFHVISNLLSVSKEYSALPHLSPPPFRGGGGRCAVFTITELLTQTSRKILSCILALKHSNTLVKLRLYLLLD